jgi:hypothetical protein
MVSHEITRFAVFYPKGVSKRRQAGALVAVLAVSFGLASCAVSPVGDGGSIGSSATPEARAQFVERRVTARWDALIKGDVDRAYAYMSAASRETMPLERYKELTRNRNFRSIAIDHVVCDSDACKVQLRLTYDRQPIKGIITPVEETWVFDHGQAWYVFRG